MNSKIVKPLLVCVEGDESSAPAAAPPCTPTSIPSAQWCRASASDMPSNQPLFTGQSGVQVPITDCMEPIDFFQSFVDDDLLRHIVVQTNIYADQHLAANQHDLGRHPRVRQLVPTNITEIKQFLGLTLLMGLVHKPSVASYWWLDGVLQTPVFGTVMKRNRFQLLLRFVHFNNNSHLPAVVQPTTDRLYKVRPLLAHLFEKFQSIYGIQQDVSVDESLLLWKGRLVFKQYLPLKCSRFGIKLFKLCESSTGYTYRFHVYVGKDDSFTLPCCPGIPALPSDFGSTEQIVWYLMLPLLGKGYRLYVDNFYTSIRLFQTLFLQKTPACGTIRSNRKEFPKQLVQQKLTLGQSSAMRRDELLAVKFTDKKDVYMLSTIHSAECTTVSVRRKTIQTMDKPNCILQYNRQMGGVD